MESSALARKNDFARGRGGRIDSITARLAVASSRIEIGKFFS
jgi:hypothetical protein